MKKFFSLAGVVALAFSSLTIFAQDSAKMDNGMNNQMNAEDKSKRPSPPASVTESVNGKTIRIDYSQPSVKGRKIWGGLVPYGEVWRTGANEATVFETNKNLMIEGKSLPAGKYALFAIPNENEWTIIFNKTWKTWGSFDYQKNKGEDALQIKVTPKKSDKFTERLTYTISKEGHVSLWWENLKVEFRVQ
jgi:hypothetical protein